MSQITRRSATLAVVAVWATSFARTEAADWPTRPVRVIVPAPPGGAYDRTIRPLAQEMAAHLRQPILIENRPGAGHTIGTHAGAMAAPDGYTLTMTGMLNTIAHGLYERVPFDIVSDFAHIACIGGSEQWLVVNSQAGIASLSDLIEQARREPGGLKYATSGQGSTGHLVMELLQRVTGTQLTHVPYQGGAPALHDVLAGLLPITVVPGSGTLPHVLSGKLKVLAVSGAVRSPHLPRVPTFEELGHKQLTVVSWVGLSAPKSTPQATVDKVYAAVRASMTNKDLLAKLANEGMTATLMPPVQYTRLVRSDTERWGQLTRSLNLRAI